MNARERSRVETRRRLIEKGTELFAENGVAETRALDIAQAAGVAHSTCISRTSMTSFMPFFSKG